ncbi:flagellar hook protein FlgE [Desulfovibrio ferrophilus]|uniref:Flagellar hook protein FlgE n=1 Tax=Desulfovibrio ferrophilus TaxID=241368 RepID=A0A2Z6B060_9BACT|nr:flagellar hook protein FlgE [Desulfovibrio ferrophilus]BBD08899.1 flagellar hook-basal body protein [Desulfovibrio ferrophilus]
MGLSASMWTGVSGLGAHGEKMSVIGNNIANVNTVGFKGARMYFEDFISQDINTAAGTAQIGRGVGIGAVYADFSQGAFETTNEPTDLAIGGRGFFKVSPLGEEQAYYTRAGNFRFDKDGYLVDPHGYVLQGWAIDNSTSTAVASGSGSSSSSVASAIKGSGLPTDIQLEGFTAQPKATTNVTMITNLDARDGNDNTTSATNPFFAMFENWNGQSDTPIGESQYAYQSTIKVYDEGGSSHNVTTYYDHVSNSGGLTYWEYMVTVDPAEDGRIIDGQTLANSGVAGVMMIGTLTFDSAGQIRSQSAFTLSSGASGDLGNLDQWTQAQFNVEGQPVFTANFTGQAGASATEESNARNIGINFGLTNPSPNAGWAAGSVANASLIGTNIANLPEFADLQVNANATTSFSGSSSTQFQSQDGYTFGFLQNVSVDRDGILTGRYSNGVVIELYQITLYDFVNKWGMRREGSNLFSQTRESGEATPGPANANGLGSIASNSLEQSNVDIATEFVKMITTERGFQANSKVITTTDNMLQQVIMMKR